MEYESMGKLIQTLRKEKGLTQKQLADMLSITDKAVSKWERDVACPDTTTLPKLADILGVTVEALLNAKTAQSPVDDELEIAHDSNPNAQIYKERLKHLLLKGLPGFVIGFVVMLSMCIVVMSAQDESVGPIIFFITFLSALVGGCVFAGLPYGWSLINRFLGQWSIFGSIPVLIFLFGLKFVLSLWIGGITYPIVLLYNLIRSQKTKRRVKIWTIVVIGAVVLWYGVIGIYAIINTRSNAGVNSNTDSTGASVVQTVDADSFGDQDTLVNKVCQNALDITKAEENDNITNYGWSIAEPTKLHGVYFISTKNPKDPHYIILKKFNVYNAIVVVTGYYVKEASSITINQWDMDVTVYPNFVYDENNSLSYDTESIYSHSLRSDDMEDFMEWFSSEYSDMVITEISNS